MLTNSTLARAREEALRIDREIYEMMVDLTKEIPPKRLAEMLGMSKSSFYSALYPNDADEPGTRHRAKFNVAQAPVLRRLLGERFLQLLAGDEYEITRKVKP